MLAKEEKIQLVGFGTFEVRDRAAERVETHKQEKKYKLQLLKCQHLRQEKN